MAEELASHFEALIHSPDFKAPAAPAVVSLDRPLMGQELQTILDIYY